MRIWRASRKIFIIVGSLIALYIAISLGYILGQHDQANSKGSSETQTISGDNPINVQGRSIAVSDIDIFQLWTLINEERTKAGIGSLVLNQKLNASALAKCNDMVQKNYWSHSDPAGNAPWHFITDAGVPYIHLAENQATGFRNSSATVNGLMASTEHKANILDPKFTDVGYSVCKSDRFVGHNNLPSLIVVQHFAQL